VWSANEIELGASLWPGARAMVDVLERLVERDRQ